MEQLEQSSYWLNSVQAEQRLGGRVHTVPLDATTVTFPRNIGHRENLGGQLEIGAQWIHGKGENRVWRFVNEQNIPGMIIYTIIMLDLPVLVMFYRFSRSRHQ